MYMFFNKIIDLWLKNNDNKVKLAYQTDTTLPTVYKVLRKDGYNIAILTQMWNDIKNDLSDEDKLEIIFLLDLI